MTFLDFEMGSNFSKIFLFFGKAPGKGETKI
jgi:hypothetical protein